MSPEAGRQSQAGAPSQSRSLCARAWTNDLCGCGQTGEAVGRRLAMAGVPRPLPSLRMPALGALLGQGPGSGSGATPRGETPGSAAFGLFEEGSGASNRGPTLGRQLPPAATRRERASPGCNARVTIWSGPARLAWPLEGRVRRQTGKLAGQVSGPEVARPAAGGPKQPLCLAPPPGAARPRGLVFNAGPPGAWVAPEAPREELGTLAGNTLAPWRSQGRSAGAPRAAREAPCGVGSPGLLWWRLRGGCGSPAGGLTRLSLAVQSST